MKSLLKKIRFAKTCWKAGPAVRRYVRHQKKRTGSAVPQEGNTILVSFCSTPTVIHTYAELVPRFARFQKASVVAFHFHPHKRPDPLTEVLYDSFGAELALFASEDPELNRKADERADEIFSALSCKQDVANIREKGILLGDLIYDTYLRDLLAATVYIRDPRLRDYIRDALIYFYSSEVYFEKNQVQAVFCDHLVYIWQGVLQRIAMHRGIPIYSAYFDPRPSAQRVDIAARDDGQEVPSRWNYWLYPEVFSKLTEEQQRVACEMGKTYLEHRLSGGIQNSVLPGQSAYAESSGTRILEKTETPKFLILLHDFCDAVHVFRNLLFEDFYEWIHFLLKEASETPFEWYVKPHPNMNDYRRRKMENANMQVLEELKRMYPKVKFLDPSVSNRQLVAEGLNGVFTMYGTAAHEFPYLGVPAVSGADNPHVAYPFCDTPTSVEEYTAMIRNAGSLGSPEQADRIPEFCYMNVLYAGEHMGADTQIFDPIPAPENNINEVFESAMRAATPESDRILDTHIQHLLEGKVPSCLNK